MMKTKFPHRAFYSALATLAGVCSLGSAAIAQDNSAFVTAPTSASSIVNSDITLGRSASFRIAPSSALSANTPIFSIERRVEEKDFQGSVVEDALNFNLGIKLEPIPGLSIRADAWQLQVDKVPAASARSNEWQGELPRLYIEDSAINEFNLDNPLLGNNLKSNGFDLGASYVWDTDRFGQFTLSSKTTYVQEFENNGGLVDLAGSELGSIGERMISPELQSNLMLTWQFGNHTASAITNYFDSFKDISELDIDEINELVDSITTIDLQYGYSIKTGSNDQAIFSVGIRNIFDKKTQHILNSTTRILDQNGRVAYGSIKYQF